MPLHGRGVGALDVLAVQPVAHPIERFLLVGLCEGIEEEQAEKREGKGSREQVIR